MNDSFEGCGGSRRESSFSVERHPAGGRREGKEENDVDRGNKAIVRRWYEEHTSLEGAERIADELLAPGFVEQVPPFPGVHGPQGYKQFIAGTYQVYPDARFEVEDLIAEGDKVVVRYTLRGTHEGTTRMGVDPTGKEIAASLVLIATFADGRIVEMWTNADFLGLMQQMGAFPAPAQ